MERKFRELNWGLRSFIVESVIAEEGQKIVLEGSNTERWIINELIYESRVNHRVVDCACGAKEDDGERMTIWSLAA